MTIEEAIRILDPETTGEALAEIEYYHGFNGKTAVVQAVLDACILAVAALREQEERRTSVTNADKIRTMTDEELAELIVKHHPMYTWNKQVREIYFSFDDHEKDNPQRAWIEWLQQPVQKP